MLLTKKVKQEMCIKIMYNISLFIYKSYLYPTELSKM